MTFCVGAKISVSVLSNLGILALSATVETIPIRLLRRSMLFFNTESWPEVCLKRQIEGQRHGCSRRHWVEEIVSATIEDERDARQSDRPHNLREARATGVFGIYP
jgi:hypothetical protein